MKTQKKTYTKRTAEKVQLGLILTSLAMPMSAQADQGLDYTIVKSSLETLMNYSMKNPTLVDNQIVYSMSSEDLCPASDGVPEDPDAAAAQEKACSDLSNGFSVVQDIYENSATSPRGKVTWRFSGHDLLSYTYGGNKIILNTRLGELRAAALAMAELQGQETSALSALLPTSGAVRLALEKTSDSSYVMLSIPEEIHHTLPAAQTGLSSDVILNLASNSFLKILTNPNNQIIKFETDLKNAYVQVPAELDTLLSVAGVSKLFSVDRFTGSLVSNPSLGFGVENLNVQNLKLSEDGTTYATIATANPYTAYVDAAALLYSAQTALDLTASISHELAGGGIPAGNYRFAHGANNSIHADTAAGLLALNLTSFELKVPKVAVQGTSLDIFPDGDYVKYSFDKVGGELNYASNTNVFTMNAFDIQQFKVKKDNTTGVLLDTTDPITLVVDPGQLSYAASSSVGLTLDVSIPLNDRAGIPMGAYRFLHGAGNYVNSNGTNSATAHLTNFALVAPANFVNNFASNLFTADSSVSFAFTNLGGTVTATSLSSPISVALQTVALTGLEFKQGDDLIVSYNQSGSFNGSFVSDLNSNLNLAMGQTAATLVIANNFGSDITQGTYSFTSGANTSVIANSGSSAITGTFNVNDLSLVVPGPTAINASVTGLNGAFNYNSSLIHTFNGSLGAGHATIAGTTIASWSQSHSSNIQVNLAAATPTLTSSDATVISIAHNYDSVGVGSIVLNLGANTALNLGLPPEVTAGSVAINLTGSTYSTLFGTGGMLNGFAFLENGGSGSISVAAQP